MACRARLPCAPAPQPQQVSLLPPVVVDAVPPAARFGDVTRQPAQAYRPGDTASATFRWGRRWGKGWGSGRPGAGKGGGEAGECVSGRQGA